MLCRIFPIYIIIVVKMIILFSYIFKWLTPTKPQIYSLVTFIYSYRPTVVKKYSTQLRPFLNKFTHPVIMKLVTNIFLGVRYACRYDIQHSFDNMSSSVPSFYKQKLIFKLKQTTVLHTVKNQILDLYHIVLSLTL